MNKVKRDLYAIVIAVALLAAASVKAADAKTYQVTGPVLEISPTTITVQKGDDKWELARNSSTKIKGELKVGAKVTIYYTMVAAEVEVKEKSDKSGKKAK